MKSRPRDDVIALVYGHRSSRIFINQGGLGNSRDFRLERSAIHGSLPIDLVGAVLYNTCGQFIGEVFSVCWIIMILSRHCEKGVPRNERCSILAMEEAALMY